MRIASGQRGWKIEWRLCRVIGCNSPLTPTWLGIRICRWVVRHISPMFGAGAKR